MIRFLVFALVAAVLAVVIPSDAMAQKKTKVEVTQKWNGSVEDEKATKPDVITSAKGLEAAWKAWKATGDVPKVDFDKNIIVAAYSVGSRLTITGAQLDDAGNLQVLAISSADFGTGFRYVLGVVSKEGVKTVNKKELPKE